MKRFKIVGTEKQVILHPCRRAEMRKIKSIMHSRKRGLYRTLIHFKRTSAKVRIGHLQFLLFHSVLSSA